jgi:hypothetical protein
VWELSALDKLFISFSGSKINIQIQGSKSLEVCRTISVRQALQLAIGRKKEACLAFIFIDSVH